MGVGSGQNRTGRGAVPSFRRACGKPVPGPRSVGLAESLPLAPVPSFLRKQESRTSPWPEESRGYGGGVRAEPDGQEAAPSFRRACGKPVPGPCSVIPAKAGIPNVGMTWGDLGLWGWGPGRTRRAGGRAVVPSGLRKACPWPPFRHSCESRNPECRHDLGRAGAMGVVSGQNRMGRGPRRRSVTPAQCPPPFPCDHTSTARDDKTFPRVLY